MLNNLRTTILQILFVVCTVLELISRIGMVASLFVMRWIGFVDGLKFMTSFYILYLMFKDISDHSELMLSYGKEVKEDE